MASRLTDKDKFSLIGQDDFGLTDKDGLGLTDKDGLRLTGKDDLEWTGKASRLTDQGDLGLTGSDFGLTGSDLELTGSDLKLTGNAKCQTEIGRFNNSYLCFSLKHLSFLCSIRLIQTFYFNDFFEIRTVHFIIKEKLFYSDNWPSLIQNWSLRLEV